MPFDRSAHHPPPARTRVRAGAVAFAIGLTLALFTDPAGARAVLPAVPRQVEDTTVTTTEDLLQGETTVVDTTAPPTTTAAASRDDAQELADADSRRVWYVVAALCGVAFLLLLLTIAYWRRTRPVAKPTRRERKAQRKTDRKAEPDTVTERPTDAAAPAVETEESPGSDEDPADEGGRRGRRSRRRKGEK